MYKNYKLKISFFTAKICENPVTFDYGKKDDTQLQVEGINNKEGEDVINTLKGSGNTWTPNEDGSSVEYIVNGKGNPVTFVDITLDVVSIDELTITLVDDTGNVVTEEIVCILLAYITEIFLIFLNCTSSKVPS